MNEMSLSRLYRRLTARPAVAPVDADALCAAVARAPAEAGRRQAAIEAIADSAAHADLARLLIALQDDSQALATQVRRVRTAMPMRAAPARRHGMMSRLRWAAPLAAGLLAAVAVLAVHRNELHHPTGMAAATPVPVAAERVFSKQDRIFSSSDALAHEATRSDELFRSDFSEGGS